MCELVAMIVSFLVAVYFQFIHDSVLPNLELESWQKLCIGVAITTVAWVLAAILSKPDDNKTLRNFCRLVNPGGPGWKKIVDEAEADNDKIEPVDKAENLPLGILCMFIGSVAVYGALFATGFWLYSNYVPAVILSVVAGFAAIFLIKFWSKVNEH